MLVIICYVWTNACFTIRSIVIHNIWASVYITTKYFQYMTEYTNVCIIMLFAICELMFVSLYGFSPLATYITFSSNFNVVLRNLFPRVAEYKRSMPVLYRNRNPYFNTDFYGTE